MSPSPADLVDDDVLAEILLLLPPESVLRSRAVCKSWLRVTTCPAFLAAYSRRRPLELLVYPDGYKLRPDDIKNILAGVDPLDSSSAWGYRRFLRLDKSLRAVDSRDGLLLLALRNTAFLICNPATRQLASLPSPAPEPCMSVVASGLYFHQPSGEHRVLCIGQHYRRCPPPRGQAAPPNDAEEGGDFHYILSTGAAEPRRLGPVARGSRNPLPSGCVALGGVLHWLRHPEAGGSGDMVAFDTASETFRRIPPPPLAGPHPHHLRAFDMGGTLAVSAVTQASLRMDVWALESDGEAWARRLRIDLPPRRIPEFQPSDEAVAVLEGGLLVVVGDGWVALHDVEAKRAVSRVDYSQEIGNVCRCLYRTSLAPLQGPRAQPPRPCPGGEPALHYWSPHDMYMSLFGNSCGMWMVPDLVYANA
ncbi:hypothetical protein C2845_PM12G01650 [Panicum miliaceum]|uniref:Uncharacterized protein n=1 Tax=Panicum miliaceum TaxID=4540 RepID=A0A3L6QH21_PANMI|nr:hypothetical protein C2845_PM12G01650 [Panicum miliaceum]